MSRYYDALTNTTMAPEVASAYQTTFQNTIDDWGNRNLTRRPRAQQSLQQFARTRLR
jgi:hypothetical protein